jgi:uncharacterized protein YqeY
VSLIEKVQSDTATALKSGDKERVQALRLITNELQKAAKESSDGDETAVLQRERKRRLEAAQAYADAGREAASPKEMGKVMSIVMPKVQGRADGKRVSAVVREKLT